MKKTIQAHIGGVQYHMDEDAYKVLQHYIDALKAHFEKDGEEGKEILTDIEQRIAELLGNIITASKQVIILPDVEEIIKTLGTIEDFKFEAGGAQEEVLYDRRANRRFYRDAENNYLGGVAAGLGSYFDIDPLWIRLAFIALIFLKGAGLLIYAILWLVVPKAVTTAQKLQMKGKPVTVNNIEESISEEYNKIKTSINTWSRSEKTRSTIDNLLKAFASVVMAFLKIILYGLGIAFLIAGSVFLAFILVLFFGNTDVFHAHGIWNSWMIPDLSGWISSLSNFKLLALSLFILVFIPLISLIYAGIKIVFHIQTKSVVLRATAFTAWILALVLFLTLLFSEASSFSIEAMGSDAKTLDIKKNTTVLIDVRDNASQRNTIRYSVFDYDILYNNRHETIYGKVSLAVIPEFDQDEITVSVKKYLRNVGMDNADDYLDEIKYHYLVLDSAIILDKYFEMDGDDFWRFGKVVIEMSVPVNTRVRFPAEFCEIIDSNNPVECCNERTYSGAFCVMTADGLKAPE